MFAHFSMIVIVCILFLLSKVVIFLDLIRLLASTYDGGYLSLIKNSIYS